MSAPAPLEFPAGSLVITDLHLDLEREEQLSPFLAWAEAAAGVPRVLILGDLFEVWFGMAQGRSPGGARVLGALANLVSGGTAVEVIPGNRDFLLGSRFETATGASVRLGGVVASLPDRSRVLFLHGDELCTLDVGYRRLRRVLRCAPVRTIGPRLPAFVGAWAGRRLRRASRRALAAKPPAEAELQGDAAREHAREAEADIVVCGHAHRFRDVLLGPEGPRWIVLDAFGGERDSLEVTGEGTLRPLSSSRKGASGG